MYSQTEMDDSVSVDDERYMVRALELARKGLLTTDPNPCVGSVVVRNDRIVGQGWHRRAGGAHAEIEALQEAGDQARGSTVYVTLEPCCHFGKTPPCVQTLIDSGVKCVVAAMEDPNPKVAGQGFRILQDAGIEIRQGVLAGDAQQMNRGFCRRMRTGRPYVLSKLAMSLDGRTALESGESKWITGERARQDVHRLRARSSAILTGIETILADDPLLNVRLGANSEQLNQPLRVILDTRLRVPINARIRSEGEPPLVLTGSNDRVRASILREAGFRVFRLEIGDDGMLDLPAVMEYLGSIGMNQVMVEAGARLNGELLVQDLVDEWIVYQSASLLGPSSRSLVQLPQLERISDRVELQLLDFRQVGKDLRLRYRVDCSTGA